MNNPLFYLRVRLLAYDIGGRNCIMRVGIRDKIQHLQLSILQDYLEIKLLARDGDGWINSIISHCENKVSSNDQRKQTYKKIADEKRFKGAVMVTKKSFDITLLNALLQFDFPNDCSPDPSDVQVFKNYIKDITNNKNDLASHISDLEDNYYIDKLERDSLFNLRNFILYLERLGWALDNERQKAYIATYKSKIQELDDELSGPKILQKVSVSIAVKDRTGNYVPDYRLKMVNDRNQIVAQWTSSNESFSILVDIGNYTIESKKNPKGYKCISEIPIQVTQNDEDKEFLVTSERSMSNEELYVEAFDCMANPGKYDKCISTLEILEKDNYLDAVLLLAFLLDNGVCGKQDKGKAQELLMFAGFQEDEATWSEKAKSLCRERKFKSAVPYYLAGSLKNGSGDGFYQAARIFLIEVKNYEICKLCFKLAVECGVEDAKKPYDGICQMSVDKYMKLL